MACATERDLTAAAAVIIMTNSDRPVLIQLIRLYANMVCNDDPRAEDQFRELHAAYEVLSDVGEREAYDRETFGF